MPKVEQRNTTTFHLQYIGKEISTSLPFISVMASSCFRRTLQYNCCTTLHSTCSEIELFGSDCLSTF